MLNIYIFEYYQNLKNRINFYLIKLIKLLKHILLKNQYQILQYI